MNVDVDVLGSPSLIVLIVDVKLKNLTTEFRSRVNVDVDVLGSPSLIVLIVDVKLNKNVTTEFRSRVNVNQCGRPGLPVPNSSYCGRKAAFEQEELDDRAQELCKR